MLEIKNLAKSFVVSNEKKVVLNDFNLQVDDGQFLVVIGSNGSGKSTLLNLIAGDIIVMKEKLFCITRKLIH